MKKARFFFLACLIVLVGLIQPVNASPADYLPAGANYLNVDSYLLTNNWFQNQEPFAIKPDTDYFLTIDNDYWRYYQGESSSMVQINVYDNDVLLQEIEFYFTDFVDNPNDIMSLGVTFHTLSNANHIDVFFYDLESYFPYYGFGRCMLEEGTAFTSFEVYSQGSLLDTASPEFDNINQVVSFVHQPITVEDILSSLEATDKIDGDVSSSIIVTEDLYTPSNTILGTYPVTFSVSDSSGNTTTCTIYVQVVDILKPEFSTIQPIELPYPQTKTLAEIQAMLNASDNYDGDITEDIYLVSDEYSSSSSLIGEYTLIYGVTDSSGNESTIQVLVKVTDEMSPVISGTNSIIIGYDEQISIDTIKSELVVVDNYDGSLPLFVDSDTYSSNHGIIGEYVIVFSAEDSSGNITTFSVSIQVVDEIGPILYYDYTIVQTYQNYVLSLEDFIHLLSLSNEYDHLDNANVKVLFDSYTTYATTPGVYHLKLLINNSIEKDFEIKVKESSDYVYLPTEDEQSFFEKYLKLIVVSSAGVVLILSNVIWFIHFKKK